VRTLQVMCVKMEGNVQILHVSCVLFQGSVHAIYGRFNPPYIQAFLLHSKILLLSVCSVSELNTPTRLGWILFFLLVLLCI
jgi:hypothetical protein